MTEALYKSDHDIFSIPFTSTSATGDLEASQALVYSPSVTPAGGFIETQFVYHNTTQSDHESFHSGMSTPCEALLSHRMLKCLYN